MMTSRIAGIATLLAVGLGAGAAACFSEKSDVSGPPSGFTCDVPVPAEIAGNTIVFIRDYEFVPAQITVAPGTRVSWINCGPLDSHTSTSDSGAWDSPLLAPGSHFTRTFQQAGEFDYHCEPHPSMRGTVMVE